MATHPQNPASPGATAVAADSGSARSDSGLELAQAEDARIVRLGNLLLFSTRSRDAWLVDIDDRLALCLCRDGDPQPFRIVDAPDTFAIEWTARFTVEDAAFIVQERSGRIVTIHGCPVAEIVAACR